VSPNAHVQDEVPVSIAEPDVPKIPHITTIATFETSWDAGLAVVTATGEIDFDTAPELRVALYAAVDAGAGRVVVDMAGVTFVDSSGLSALVGAQKRMRGSESDVVLVGPPAVVERLLAITGLTDSIVVYPDLAAAVAR
jgi:anti-sigma B factor antagonist